MTTFTATYSPEDNKLRLYASSRLDADLYKEVRECGFIWAPKQGLFVAPMWTPAREEFLLSLVDEIEDEDKSLCERAEERADRFSDYKQSRTAEAQAARNTVARIADNIPFGQPILVGHHSERHARRDAQKIENGMRKAVQLWDTAEYWKRRAAGALSHAKYKELPAVRARRIKGLDTDKRRMLKNIASSEPFIQLWGSLDMTTEKAIKIANYDRIYGRFSLAEFPRDLPATQSEDSLSLWSALNQGIINGTQAAAMAITHHTQENARLQKWLTHYENRLTYENAMLEEQGGTAATKYDLVVGGKAKIGREWVLIVRINRKDGKIVSVSTNARYCSVRGVEEITDYTAPTADEAALVKAATKLAPMANYPDENTINITQAQWNDCDKDYKGSMEIAATATTGRHRVRKMLGCFADSSIKDSSKRHQYPAVFITDAKRVDPPKKTPETPEARQDAAPDLRAIEMPLPEARQRIETPTPVQGDFDLMRESLKQGVQVVSAEQLFPTPEAVADEMLLEANLQSGQDVLDPEGGTGALLRAVRSALGDEVNLTAVEINHALCGHLRQRDTAAKVICRDFLTCGDELGKFDKILMNPPFANGQDIAHIKHARKFLKPNGKIIAICAAGPRQKAELLPLVEECGGTWRDLPANSFASSHTGVNTILLTLHF